MKKILTLTAMICLPLSNLLAQATPNASFENWTTQGFPSYSDPDNWESANSQTAIIGQFGCIKATGADVHTGTAAVKLITKNLLSVDAPGVVTTGTLPTSTGDPITGGIPYTLRPDSIVGWYKYTPAGGDNGFAEFMLFGSAPNNADTVGKARFDTPNSTVSTYTRFAASIEYFNNNPVANSIWLLCSSKDDVNMVIGSTIYFDDLALVFAPLSANISSQTNASCNGLCNGTATAGTAGGTSPFTYAWSNSQNGSTATGLCQGTYTVTVTDATSATSTATVTITQPSLLTAAATSTSALCNGIPTGSLSATGSGGNSGYSYSWSGGLGSGPDKYSVAAGTYTVTVTDSKGCTATAMVSVTEPAALTATAVPGPVLCKGAATGSITVTASGGTLSYSYLWSNGATGQTNSNIGAGTYTVTITDGNSCTATVSANVTEPATAVTVTVTSTDASCGGSDGSASATAGGGTGSISYLWSNSSTSTSITGLGSGTYTVTATDANGCTATAAANVSNSGGPTASISSQTNITGCYGDNTGSATVTATGGTGALTYTWSTTPAQTGTIATGLIAGTYTVTISDAVACQAIVSVTITQPQLLTAITTPTNVTCNSGNSGSATVTPSGGTPSYSFIWTNSQTASTATGLAAGSYSVTVTDSKGCSASASATITEPPALVATTTSTPDSGSAEGTATVIPSGGIYPYSYAWSSGNQTLQTATGLAAGNYTVTVTDANGCTLVNTANVNLSQSIGKITGGLKSQLIIYPNPARDQFLIEAADAPRGYYEIKITSITGQVLMAFTYYHAGGMLQKEVNSAGMERGLSIVWVTSGEARVGLPLLKIE